MPNRFVPLQPGTDQSQQIAVINQNFGELDNETVKKLYDDTSGNHRIFLDGAAGTLKIAKSGFDVTKATDDQLAFNSAQNTLKIVQTGTASLVANVLSAGGSVEVLVPHNLGYAPIPQVYSLINGYYKPLPTYTGITTSGVNMAFNTWVECMSDSTNLVIRFWSGTINNWGTFNFKYYLLQETAN